VSISDVFGKEIGIGGVLGLLWFRKSLPASCAKFISAKAKASD